MPSRRHFEDGEPRYWYAARPHRFGYRRPLTWQGWAFDIGVILGCVVIAPYVQAPKHPWQSLALVFGVLALVVAVRHFKGEPAGSDD